ncbi:hypothetical protein [Methylocystis sp. H62]|uniref:hypothetical protein n=1 Tax=Methylocystis sp. H62 TaxID=2785789 RepID=UPI001FEEB0C1|nr:hypothetical protein [Methylocystis sp. H62]
MTGIIEIKILAEFVGTDGVLARREVFVVRRNVDQLHLKDFGLTLEEGKVILQRVQAEQTQFQVEQCGLRDRNAQAASGGAPSMIIEHVSFTLCLGSVGFARLDFDSVAVWLRMIRCLQVD